MQPVPQPGAAGQLQRRSPVKEPSVADTRIPELLARNNGPSICRRTCSRKPGKRRAEYRLDRLEKGCRGIPARSGDVRVETKTFDVRSRRRLQ